MKTHSLSLILLTLASLMLVAAPAKADSVLYNNGGYDDDVDAWQINGGFVVSDTFTLTGSATVTGFQFNTWMLPHDVLTTAEFSITSNEMGGTTYFDQTLRFTQSQCVTNAYGYDACLESASLNGPTLNAGTYWLILQNAAVSNGDPVYWDENSGEGCTSPGCPSQASDNQYGTIPSESFTVLGNASTTGSTPEPDTIVLFGSGVLAVATTLRRRSR
jgi:hypothetical protein